jgi:hypothetical protein
MLLILKTNLPGGGLIFGWKLWYEMDETREKPNLEKETVERDRGRQRNNTKRGAQRNWGFYFNLNYYFI